LARHAAATPGWLGAAAFSGALVFGLIRGNAYGWASSTIVGAFTAGGVLLAAFAVTEAVQREPMLDRRLFRRPAFTGTTLAAVATMASLFSMLLYITLFLQNVLGYSAFQTGLRFLPSPCPPSWSRRSRGG
jgi:predicted MFS family arabinose efflux permease